jgi:predicted site-specific integrase-resolvase
MKNKFSKKTKSSEQQATADHDKLLSPAEFAGRIGACTATVRRLEKRGLIRGLRLSKRCVRYPESQLQRLIDEAA